VSQIDPVFFSWRCTIHLPVARKGLCSTANVGKNNQQNGTVKSVNWKKCNEKIQADSGFCLKLRNEGFISASDIKSIKADKLWLESFLQDEKERKEKFELNDRRYRFNRNWIGSNRKIWSTSEWERKNVEYYNFWGHIYEGDDGKGEERIKCKYGKLKWTFNWKIAIERVNDWKILFRWIFGNFQWTLFINMIVTRKRVFVSVKVCNQFDRMSVGTVWPG